MPLAPSQLNQISDLGDEQKSTVAIEAVNLEVDSNTDLPQEYFLFIQQENQSMKEEIEEITASFRSDALEHRQEKESWLAELADLEAELA